MGKGKTKLEPLADGLVKADSGGDGDVEAVDFAGHGNIDKVVAAFSGDFTNTPALTTEDKSGGLVEINRVEGAVAAVGGADDLDAVFLEFTKEDADVFDLEEGDFVSAAAGDIADGMGDAAGTFHGRKDSSNAGAGGSAQAGPQVVGILHALKDEEEGIFSAFKQVVEVVLFFEMHHGGALRIARGAYDFMNGVATHNEKLQQLGLFFTVGFEPGELPAFIGEDASLGSALQVALLNQEGFVDFLEGVGFFAYRYRDGS